VTATPVHPTSRNTASTQTRVATLGNCGGGRGLSLMASLREDLRSEYSVAKVR
jgi:hypothetical protein